jgi:beta-galactosidase
MKKRSILFLVFLLCALNSLIAANRTKYNFNPDWKLFVGDDSTAKNVDFNDLKWKSVILPSTFNEKDAFRISIEKLTDTVIWYRKTFKIPSEHSDQKIFIEFEGARQSAEVWVNGHWIGLHEDGIMAFGFDLTKYVNFGSKHNVIAVRIGNANYGGLTNNVFLHTTDKIYQTLPLYNNLKTNGVYVYADNFDIKGKRAVLHIQSEVKNEYSKPKAIRINVLVRDKDKLLVREFQSEEVTLQPGETKIVPAMASMKNLQFWSWGYGYLYEVNTSITVGNKVVDLVRTITGFRKTEFAKGVFKLNDRVLQLKGYAQGSGNEWPGVGMSVPAWLSDYSNNLMVESNANLVRWMPNTPWKQDVESCDRVGLIQAMPAGDSEKEVTDRSWERRKEVMRDAIVYNKNNPSIILYECANSGISEKQMGEMLEIRNEFDPYGGRAIGSRDMLDSKIAEYGGEMLYINKSAKFPVWSMDYGRDEALCKNLDNKSYPLQKQGEDPINQDYFAMETVIRWFDYYRERPGTGKRVSSGGVSSGKLDAMRIKKEAWWAHYVMWDGWVDLEKFHTHIVGHWNYEKGTRKNVYVISSGDKVELFLNNVSLGFGEQSSRFWFTFKDVAFQPGVLRAVSYDQSKKNISEATCSTAGTPKSLKLNMIQSPDGFCADGADMVLVEVEVVDANGQRCPLADDMISFEVKGPVEFIGGITQESENHIRTQKLPVECGVNRILIRSTRQAGPVMITVKSGDLISDTLSLESKKVEILNGLSTQIPATKLLGRLTRGATPVTSSFVISRIPVSVINATAGANDKDAVFSFDDNEKTEWRNNGAGSTAWIKYDLVRKAELSEICLKLTDWTTRSYQIRILAEDGSVLWEGATACSLGYITLPLKKGVVTRSVRLELLNKNLNLFDKNSPGSGESKDELRIVEIEFYEGVE